MRRWFRHAKTPAHTTDETGAEAGHLDTVEVGVVIGWAYQRLQPERRVKVRVLVDGRIVAEDVADRYRRDLEILGHGDGCYGFAIPLPAALLDGLEHAVEAIDADTGIRLPALSRNFRLGRDGDAERACINLLFDPGFYEAQGGPADFPLDHYRKLGWRRGLDPHPLFSTKHYIAQHGRPQDDPLTDFAVSGQWSNAWTHPLLDPAAESPPLRTRDGDGGGREARVMHPVLAYLSGEHAPERPLSRHFSDADYLARYPGVGPSGIVPLSHYLAFGWREGLRPHPDFDPALFGKLAGLDRTQEPYTHLLQRLKDQRQVAIPAAPAVSVIVLNHNKSFLTLQCLHFLDAHTDMAEVEVIVVDNGSRPPEFERLARHARGITLVRLNANRGFGEANNIGTEHARGSRLVFLNNDAFVRPGWLEPLIETIGTDPEVGAAGAKLLYPDGRLQEAGAMISACGTAVQRGKHLDPRAPAYNRREPVDYCSAAALMVRADAFRAVLGFDLCWDPAYYEDADLCLKLRLIGQKTVYVPTSEVVHIEHATSADQGLDLRLHDIVAVNRLKFVGRWGDWLAKLPDAPVPALAWARSDVPTTEARSQSERTLALYTPYPLTPGGGERYLLTIATALRDRYRCVLLTPDRYSRLRLLTIGGELGLDLDHVAVMPLAEAEGAGRFDLFVCMANEVLPPMRGLGRANLYHCQFPFPMAADHYGRGWQNLASYQGVVVNSAFTAGHFARAAAAVGVASPPLHVLSPPVPQAVAVGLRGSDDVRRILSVGRFAPGGHCKHQDRMIAEFARLCDQVEGPMELHLAGAVGSDGAARAYLQDLVVAARDLPVTVHPNASAERIAALYGAADLYWHLTGAGEDVVRKPERFEHFGIALCEAMSAGAVPVALGEGGPREIITDGRDGVLIGQDRDLSRASAELLRDPARLARLGAAARTRVAAFAPNLFAERLRTIVADLETEAPLNTDLMS